VDWEWPASFLQTLTRCRGRLSYSSKAYVRNLSRAGLKFVIQT
jgi:hypothetical protein